MSSAKVELSEEKARTNNKMEELLDEFDKASSATAALETEVKELRQMYIDKTEVRATVLFHQRQHYSH